MTVAEILNVQSPGNQQLWKQLSFFLIQLPIWRLIIYALYGLQKKSKVCNKSKCAMVTRLGTLVVDLKRIIPENIEIMRDIYYSL